MQNHTIKMTFGRMIVRSNTTDENSDEMFMRQNPASHASLVAVTCRSGSIGLSLSVRQGLMISFNFDMYCHRLSRAVPQKEYRVNLH
jgi:hypothetical protein